MENNIAKLDINAVTGLFNSSKILLFILGIISIWLLVRIINGLAERLILRFPSQRFRIYQAKTLIVFLLSLGGVALLFISVIQPPKEVIIAAAGSLAVALGFALKDVAASLISGVLLIFDRPFSVGDRINFDDIYGEIVSIGLRSVKLRTLDDNIVSIPNARFINDVVSSGNYGELDMMVTCQFHLPVDCSIDNTIALIREVIVTSRFAYLKKPVSFTVHEVIDMGKVLVCVTSKSYVLDLQYEKAFQTDIYTHVYKKMNAMKVTS